MKASSLKQRPRACAGAHTRRCELLESDYVSARSAALHEILRTSTDWRHWLGYTMSHDVLETGYTFAARSQARSDAT